MIRTTTLQAAAIVAASCARMLCAKVVLFCGIVWRKYYDHRLSVRDALSICAAGWSFPPRPGTWGRPQR